ncbi:hypothetical protein [Streptosporangium nondiastaticum]|uniref:hypothetical protein n=1 Tax=Streptosporangium nondiastaticum TaxID=35764 RepID=UPI0011B24A6A|nr:hypothetical protein [Streptosporangium nondiastaticum]
MREVQAEGELLPGGHPARHRVAHAFLSGCEGELALSIAQVDANGFATAVQTQDLAYGLVGEVP